MERQGNRMRYRFVGNGRRWIRRLGIHVESGQAFDAGEVVINDANFVEIKDSKETKGAADEAAKEG